MKYIKTNWSIPYYNMAFENYVMNSDKFDEDYIFFYIHDPSIIVGKHQNTVGEVNKKYVEDNNIYLSRRNTGGGAVYHDHGNLNFSFIFRKTEDDINFEKYTMPVINALKVLGVNSELSGRNDIVIDDKKISGNAQYMNNKKVLHHGTLMFDVNVEALVNSLNVSQMKIESKAIKSIRSRVANIKDYLDDKDMDVEAFKEFLLSQFYKDIEMEEYKLDKEDLAAVNKLVDEKFSTWEHNYGNSPAFSIEKKKKYPAGMVEARIDVKDGVINDIKINGDYFFKEDTKDLEEILKGIKYREDSIRAAISKINIGDFMTNLTDDEFVDLLLN